MRSRIIGWSMAAVGIVGACGGKSLIREGDDSSAGGDAGDTTPAGGRPTVGGTTGAAPVTGGAFTGGTGTSGTFSGGGTAPIAGSGFGAAGQGGFAGQCSAEPLPGAPSKNEPLRWSDDGRIEWSQNAFGVQGSWYTADDCPNRPLYLDCTLRDQALVGPDGQFGWTTTNQEACAKGIAPQVKPKSDGTLAYAEQWGILIGFLLNEGRPWIAASRCVTGIQFDVTATAPARLRVNLPTTETAGNAHFVEIALPAKDLAFAFSSFAQGAWVPNPVPLDTSELTNVEFHVFTNESAPTPFDFCVSNVRFIYEIFEPE